MKSNFNYFLKTFCNANQKFPRILMDNCKKKINTPTNVYHIREGGGLKRQTLTNKTKINFHSHIYLITKQQTNKPNKQQKKFFVELKSRTLSISNSRLYFLCLMIKNLLFCLLALGVKSLHFINLFRVIY